MLDTLKIDDYLKFLSDEKVKYFVAIILLNILNSQKKKCIFKPSEKQKFQKVAESLYIFPATPHDVVQYVQSNSSNYCIHRYNVEILNLF